MYTYVSKDLQTAPKLHQLLDGVSSLALSDISFVQKELQKSFFCFH